MRWSRRVSAALFASGIFSNRQVEPADCPQKENPRHGGTYSGSDGEQNLHVQRTKAWPQSSRCGALSACSAASCELRRENNAGGAKHRRRCAKSADIFVIVGRRRRMGGRERRREPYSLLMTMSLRITTIPGWGRLRSAPWAALSFAGRGNAATHERPSYLPSPKPRLGGRLFSSACALAGLRCAYRLELRAIFRLCLNTLAPEVSTKATVEDAAPA
jgi:hypothetical protein